MVVKNRHHFRLPGRLDPPRGRGRPRQPPGVVVAGHDSEHLAELLDWMAGPLLVNELQLAHGVGECEKMAMAFFKMSSSYASRLLAARSARTSAASAGSVGKGCCAACCHA